MYTLKSERHQEERSYKGAYIVNLGSGFEGDKDGQRRCQRC